MKKRTVFLLLIFISLVLVASVFYAKRRAVIFYAKSFSSKATAYFNSYYYKNDYKALMNLLQLYECFNGKERIQLVRNGKPHDGGYVVPLKAFEESDVLFGYGVGDDISFEEEFSNKYQKPSFGFDCGIENIQINNARTKFVRECIGTDKYLYENQQSNSKISSFREQLSRLDFQNKKIFIKMDIEGAEYEVFDDILAMSNMVTGLVIEIHDIHNVENLFKANKLLSAINKDFYLIHVHGNNCTNDFIPIHGSLIPAVMELTYINKLLVTNARKSVHQSYPKPIDMPNCATKKEAYFSISGS